MNVSSVCGSWNSNINGSMVSILGLESDNRKQFWDLETNTNTTTHFNNNNGKPFINPTTNIFDCGNLSSSSSNFATNFFPYSQCNDYSSTGYLKEEDGGFAIDEGNYSSSGRIGLNLGRRTYFSSRETVVIDQLLQRPRGLYQANQVPRCQAEGCRIDLTNAKQYHKRHKVCELHSKAIKVVASGLEQRFCQQCSRFHLLTEFDESKRSCRKRLADHNRRRRKPQHGSSDSIPYKTAEKAFSQVKSSVSSPRSELKETSLSSPILPLMVSKSTINNKASTIIAETNWVFKETEATTNWVFKETEATIGSLSREVHRNLATTTPQRHFIFNNNNNDPTTLFQRENNLSPYQNIVFSTSNEVSQSTGGGSDQSQNPENLQNQLHLGQAMFEVEFQT